MRKALNLMINLPATEVIVFKKKGFWQINEKHQPATWQSFKNIAFMKIAQEPIVLN